MNTHNFGRLQWVPSKQLCSGDWLAATNKTLDRQIDRVNHLEDGVVKVHTMSRQGVVGDDYFDQAEVVCRVLVEEAVAPPPVPGFFGNASRLDNFCESDRGFAIQLSAFAVAFVVIMLGGVISFM